MIRNSSRHCRRLVNPTRCLRKGGMRPAKVVMEREQSDGPAMVCQLFAERISQSRESTRRHANRQVRPLDVAGRDVPGLRIAKQRRLDRALTDRRAVSSFGLRRGAVNRPTTRAAEATKPTSKKAGSVLSGSSPRESSERSASRRLRPTRGDRISSHPRRRG
jgi:hypothetical protein